MRTISLILGVGALAFLGVSIGPIAAAAPVIDPLYEAVAIGTVFGGPVVVGLAAPWLSLRALRWCLGLLALAFVPLVLGWVPALGGARMPAGVPPWPVEVTALATVPAALAWRPWLAWAYLTLNSVIIAPVRYLAAGDGDLSTPLQYAFFTLTFAGIFTATVIVALRNARALEGARATERWAAAEEAAAEAARRERARLDALVHDAVMGTLYFASHGDARLDSAVRTQAARALAQLQELRSADEPHAADLNAAELEALLADVVGAAGEAVAFRAVGDREAPIPRSVAAAFAEATAEALRNSFSHAGPEPVTRSVTLETDVDRVRVLIADSGRGFDPAEVSPNRLGIRVSIRGRFEVIPGGSTHVEAAPGAGTRVMLEWSAP